MSFKHKCQDSLSQAQVCSAATGSAVVLRSDFELPSSDQKKAIASLVIAGARPVGEPVVGKGAGSAGETNDSTAILSTCLLLGLRHRVSTTSEMQTTAVRMRASYHFFSGPTGVAKCFCMCAIFWTQRSGFDS